MNRLQIGKKEAMQKPDLSNKKPEPEAGKRLVDES
jgi:hypothetical protein